MIDIENTIINGIKTGVETAYPGIVVYSDFTETPASFPCIFVAEDNNTTYEGSAVGNVENHARVTYTVNVYTNNKTGKKMLAKKIADTVDGLFIGWKFTRSMMAKTPNIDNSIYRITMRYTAVVAKPILSGDGDSATAMYQIYKS